MRDTDDLHDTLSCYKHDIFERGFKHHYQTLLLFEVLNKNPGHSLRYVVIKKLPRDALSVPYLCLVTWTYNIMTDTIIVLFKLSVMPLNYF